MWPDFLKCWAPPNPSEISWSCFAPIKRRWMHQNPKDHFILLYIKLSQKRLGLLPWLKRSYVFSSYNTSCSMELDKGTSFLPTQCLYLCVISTWKKVKINEQFMCQSTWKPVWTGGNPQFPQTVSSSGCKADSCIGKQQQYAQQWLTYSKGGNSQK